MTLAGPLQVIDVRPLGDRLLDDETVSLAKSRKIELLRVVVRPGEEKPAYVAPGEVIVQCLEGTVLLTVFGQKHELQAGQLIHLPADAPHSLKGREAASLLLTVLLSEEQTEARRISSATRREDAGRRSDEGEGRPHSTGARG